ncbi:hypothetical protein AURDEDRAFT_111587 [Auricularia subglabra TFB-10046 SS5]|nr:hypothetical protein AURDEDRAFT_111587 [Auricularia subglabra TFB-10046 SS5]
MLVTAQLDDISPLIQYQGAWRAGTRDDPHFTEYSNGGTFTLTTSNDASATISWNGPGITVYGAKRPNHNRYSVTLNNGMPRIFDGNGEEEFGLALYSVHSLADGPNTIVIKDASNSPDPGLSFFDLDYVVLETEVNGSHSVQIEDFEPAFQYAPSAEQWTSSKNLLADSDGSAHTTTTKNAAMTLYFSGSAVDLRGRVCATCGQYSVSIDGGPEEVFSARNLAWNKDQQLLYVSRGLEEGIHHLRVKNVDGRTLGISSAVVYGNNPGGVTAPPPPRTTDTTSSPKTTSTSPAENANGDGAAHHGRKFPVVEVVAGILGALLIILAIFVFILLRQRRRRGRRPGPVSNNRESIMSPISPGALASPFTMPATPASVAMSTIQLGLRPPTPASIRASSRTASPVPFARSAPSLSPSDPFASSASSTSGLLYDERTLASSPPPPASHEPSVRSHSPAPALVLHEAPPAYDNSSRPPSLLLRGDRKM